MSVSSTLASFQCDPSTFFSPSTLSNFLQTCHARCCVRLSCKRYMYCKHVHFRCIVPDNIHYVFEHIYYDCSTTYMYYTLYVIRVVGTCRCVHPPNTSRSAPGTVHIHECTLHVLFFLLNQKVHNLYRFNLQTMFLSYWSCYTIAPGKKHRKPSHTCM